MEKKWKSFCLLISPETHERINLEIKKVEGSTKTQWIREAIAEKFKKKGESNE